MNLYPLTFVPLFKEKIWGGNKIKKHFAKELPGSAIGEYWALCCRKDADSLVANGSCAGMPLSRLLFAYPKEILGNAIYELYGSHFPLLFKFIDAAQNLSIQVHPKETTSTGISKDEFWYILEAPHSHGLLVGLIEDVGKVQLQNAIVRNNLVDITQKIKANTGDFIYVPAGQIHAITSGFFVAEISENSDTTYRLYDWDRIDLVTNKPRALHIEQALQAICYEHLPLAQIAIKAKRRAKKQNGPQIKEFATDRLTITNATIMNSCKEGFSVFLCLDGYIEVSTDTCTVCASAGEAILIPAMLGTFMLDGTATVLHTYYHNQKE